MRLAPTPRSLWRPAQGCGGVCRCPPRSRGRSWFLSPAFPIRPRPKSAGQRKPSGVLINVEDDRRRSDFHSAAVFRRGDLTVAISTNGKSPGLAALMRRVLEHRIGPKWEIRLDEIAALRQGWREAGADPAAIGRWTQEWVDRRGWLDPASSDPSHQGSRPIP